MRGCTSKELYSKNFYYATSLVLSSWQHYHQRRAVSASLFDTTIVGSGQQGGVSYWIIIGSGQQIIGSGSQSFKNMGFRCEGCGRHGDEMGEEGLCYPCSEDAVECRELRCKVYVVLGSYAGPYE